jgi:hypothetical protein
LPAIHAGVDAHDADAAVREEAEDMRGEREAVELEPQARRVEEEELALKS